MNTSKTIGSLLIVMLAGASCGTKNNSVPVSKMMENSPVVGKYVQAGDDKVLSCDLTLLKDTVRLPLSFFVENLDIIKLDNRDEALVKETGLIISDNYIMTQCGYPPQPFKLFDRTGKFLTNIGGIGQGPGEYSNIYGSQIDEPNDRIYLLPWQSDQLLVYDLKGNALDPIPLCQRCQKAKFYVDTKGKTVSVVLLPFPGTPNIAWTQDMEGKVITAIPTGHLEVPWDYSNEVGSSMNVPGVFDASVLCIIPTRVDSLYRYDYANNRLRPTFTLNFPNTDKIPWHGYVEWPDYFVGDVSEPPIESAPNQWTNGKTYYYIVDKNTCKGSYFTLYNDYFADQEIGWATYVFNNGYYSRNIEPGNLLTDIETLLKNQNLTDEMRKKLTDLQGTIGDNDNNYVMIARMKK